MENQQPIKQKDLRVKYKSLQDFQKAEFEKLKELPATMSSLDRKVSFSFASDRAYIAYTEYIDDLVQQAKHAAFEDGCKFQKLVCAEEVANIDEGWYSEIAQNKCWNSPDAQNPYEPREKGGEGE